METQTIIQEIEREPKSVIRLQDENKLIKIINKGLILGKSADELAKEIIETSSSIPINDISFLITSVKKAIDINSTNQLLKEDFMHAEKIILNQFNKNPNAKISELLKDIKVALSINAYDDELKEIIQSIKTKYLVDFESLGIDSRFKPKRKDFYITEEKKGAFIAIGPNNSQPNGYVIGFSKNKLFFIGYKDEIMEQDYTRNRYKIKLIYGLLPGGKIITKLDDRGVLCKNVALEEIPDSLAEEIKKKFLKEEDEIAIGFSLSGGNLRKINGKIELENLPYAELLDDLQSRIAMVGPPGCGKTLVTNIIQRQTMSNEKYLQGGAVTITKDVPHLTNVGHEFKSFGEHVPNWDEDNCSEEFINNVDLTELKEHKKITISTDCLIPDINKLSKETIIALIENSSCSEQVKIALKKHIEEGENVVDVLNKAKEGNLLGEEYLSCQDNALKRLINSIIPANYEKVKKLDIRKTLESKKYLSFFIKGLNGDTLATMIMWELYVLQKHKEIINPIIQGRLLVIDEGQKFMRDAAFKDIFQRSVLDGRNFGICMMTIFQNEKEAEKNMGYPDFVTYKASLDNGKRIIQIREKIALIPPLAPGGD